MTNSNIPFSRDAYDDLADLFLTEPVESASPVESPDDVLPLPFPGRAASGDARPQATKPRVAFPPHLVAMMRVNLPVIAGPWLEQAAAAIAAEAGPVALIRERGEHTTMDLVSGRDGQQAAAAALTGPAESLPGTVARLRRIISCWAVEAQVHSPDRSPDWSHFDEIVLLTGADEAATVAVFAQIKAICGSATAVPRLSLVIVGSDEDTARSTADRIARACQDSLECTVHLRAIIRRMQPVPMRHLGRFALHTALIETLTTTLNQRAAAPAPASGSTPTEPTTAPRPAAPDATPARVALPPRLGSAAVVEPPMPEVIPRCAQPTASDGPSTRQAPIAPEPTPTERTAAPDSHSSVDPPTHARQTQSAESVIGQLVSLLGDLQSIDVECPRAAGVEFAFDRCGGLHVVTEDNSEAALQRLYVACDWAREHRTLLTRLDPWLASATRQAHPEVTAHLFTNRPRQRRHLADGALRIHILVRDGADGRIIAHLDLN